MGAGGAPSPSTTRCCLPTQRCPAPGIPAPPADAALPDPALWASVAALPERQRHAVVLKYVADLDHAQIATALTTTPAMSRRLVSDALAALRKAHA